MGAVPPEDLPAARSFATALPLERSGTGQLPALLAPDKTTLKLTVLWGKDVDDTVTRTRS